MIKTIFAQETAEAAHQQWEQVTPSSACQHWQPDPNPILPEIDGFYTTPWDTTVSWYTFTPPFIQTTIAENYVGLPL